MKRAITLILIIVTLIPILTSAFIVHAAEFNLSSAFADVPKDCWYNSSAAYCYTIGYMQGTAKGTFSPSVKLTRAMAAKIFHTMSGSTKSYTNKTFTDVNKNNWFYTAVEWAYENKITNGTGYGRFSPNHSITRQDFITMMHSYYIKFGHSRDVAHTNMSVHVYNDWKNISSYAFDSFEWSVNYGLINGFSDFTLRPKSLISRAEVSEILYAYDSTYGHNWQTQILSQRSCVREGKYVHTCSLCNDKRTITLSAYHLWKNTKSSNPTCTKEGIKEYRCSACNQSYKEISKALGHTWAILSTVKPTHSKKGYSNYKCSRCSITKIDNYTDVLPRTEGWDSNYDGKLTIDEYFGAYEIAEFLTENGSDYLGTPYKALANYFDTPWRLLRNKGQYPNDAAMNCTGFVASVIQRCGGNFERLSNYYRGAYANGYNWQRTIETKNIYHYTFRTVSEARNSGKMRKGDVMYFVPPAGSDCHLGIFWGDTPYDNKIWHSTCRTSYNAAAGVVGCQNQITGISSGTPYMYFYVMPLQRNS